jgi:hypothetical protein
MPPEFGSSRDQLIRLVHWTRDSPGTKVSSGDRLIRPSISGLSRWGFDAEVAWRWTRASALGRPGPRSVDTPSRTIRHIVRTNIRRSSHQATGSALITGHQGPPRAGSIPGNHCCGDHHLGWQRLRLDTIGIHLSHIGVLSAGERAPSTGLIPRDTLKWFLLSCFSCTAKAARGHHARPMPLPNLP